MPDPETHLRSLDRAVALPVPAPAARDVRRLRRNADAIMARHPQFRETPQWETSP